MRDSRTSIPVIAAASRVVMAAGMCLGPPEITNRAGFEEKAGDRAARSGQEIVLGRGKTVFGRDRAAQSGQKTVFVPGLIVFGRDRAARSRGFSLFGTG
jgi:hypothetical protein